MHSSTTNEHKTTLPFGERLAVERKILGLSQKDAAEKCGVRREMWGRYERGEAEPGVRVLEHFCALGAKPGVLLGTKALENPDVSQIVLDQIAAELELFDRVHELDEIGAMLLKDRVALLNDPHERKHSVLPPDVSPWSYERLRHWLAQSPKYLPSPSELEHVIERLEFALSVSGKNLEHYDKALAIVRLVQETKKLPTEREADRTLALKVRELIDSL